jgi:hypothetical protein
MAENVTGLLSHDQFNDSVCGRATRHGLNPWSYLRDVLDQLAVHSADADVGDLFPDAWSVRHARIN